MLTLIVMILFYLFIYFFYRDELSHVGEQLAAQHAQYTQLRNNPAANPEHVCAEKIAEQQLRIKQVCYVTIVCIDT